MHCDTVNDKTFVICWLLALGLLIMQGIVWLFMVQHDMCTTVHVDSKIIWYVTLLRSASFLNISTRLCHMFQQTKDIHN